MFNTEQFDKMLYITCNQRVDEHNNADIVMVEHCSTAYKRIQGRKDRIKIY